MSGSSDQHPSKHVIDIIDLETAICEARADALLLMLAIENMGRGDAWNFLNKEPQDGYRLYLLTNDQVRALGHGINRVLSSTRQAAVEFLGHELADAV